MHPQHKLHDGLIKHPQQRSHGGHAMYPQHRCHGGQIMCPQHRSHGGHAMYPHNRSHGGHVMYPQHRSRGGHAMYPQHRSHGGHIMCTQHRWHGGIGHAADMSCTHSIGHTADMPCTHKISNQIKSNQIKLFFGITSKATNVQNHETWNWCIQKGYETIHCLTYTHAHTHATHAHLLLIAVIYYISNIQKFSHITWFYTHYNELCLSTIAMYKRSYIPGFMEAYEIHIPHLCIVISNENGGHTEIIDMSIHAEAHHDNFSRVLYMVDINLIHDDTACVGQRMSRIHCIVRTLLYEE